MNEHYVPGSPIFRDDSETPPITPAPPSTPKSRGKGIGANNFHAMTVSVTQTTQGRSTITATTKPCTASRCYASTRSAAMMALALGGQPRPKSPATTTIPKTNTNNSKNAQTTNSNNKSAINFSNSNNSPTPSQKTVINAVNTNNKSPNAVQQIVSNNSPTHNRQITVASVHMNGGTSVGFASGGSASSGSDNDGFNTSSSSSATALRRLYFKSGRKSKTNSTVTSSITNIPLNAISTAAQAFHTSISGAIPLSAGGVASPVPKLVIMGSSSASIPDANVNTSTDSASTLVTSVTHTDTSETCDSLDLGDNSGPSEPLFSSLEEPLLTAIQIDSEYENGTELELRSRFMYNRPDMNVQDSTESQESSLSILTIESSSTTPLLASHRQQSVDCKATKSAPYAAKLTSNITIPANNPEDRLPNTAPAPSSGMKHFIFDPPTSPKSARTSEKSCTHFSFKEQQTHQPTQQQRRGSNWDDQRVHTTNFIEEHSPTSGRRENSPGRSKYRAYAAQRHAAAAAAMHAPYYQHQLADDEESLEATRSKKSRSREASNSTRQRYSAGGSGAVMTSPKREQRRSPSSSAPPTMKEAHFFTGGAGGKPKQLSPATQQRKYSSSSSSGGSERGRERGKDSTMFPFDREVIDYERIQRECFALDENSSTETSTSDSDDAEPCSVYERKMSAHHISPSKTGEVFRDHYKLLAQHEQSKQPMEGVPPSGGPPSRKNSKRLRSSSVIHSTIRESQTYVPKTDAFYPQQQKVKLQSPGEYTAGSGNGSGVCSRQHSPKSYSELNKFDEIASKFDQIPPKQQPYTKTPPTTGISPSASNSNVLIGRTLQALNGSANHNGGGGIVGGIVAPSPLSPTGSTRGTISPPLPNLRVDFFAESQMMHPRKRSSSKKKEKMGMSSAMHDILDNSQRVSGGGTIMGGGAGPINVTSNPMDVAVCAPPRATIVVQQPSLSLDNTVETLLIKNEDDFISVEQGKGTLTATGAMVAAIPAVNATHARTRNSQQLQHPPHHPTTAHQQHQTVTQQQQKRDENMRQLLDVTNALTFEELRDFEMRYGSPHHSRSQSVKTPGSRASGRPNQLCLPQQRSRVASMPNTGVEEEYYRLRHFSITGKGVVNRGDSLKSRRSRSNNSVASSNSSTEHLTAAQQLPAPTSARTSATCSLASSRESSTSNPGSGPYRVLMLGGPAVGKSSLVSQFMTSEYLHAYDTSIDDESGEKSVSVLLNGEESELIFIDHAYTEMTPDDCLTNYDPHGYCVIYSAADRSSFNVAEHVLQVLWTNQNIAQKAVILVANKADLARSRLVTSDEGKAMATAYDCKFIETSVGINHNVDELLVGLLSQIRLKLENPEKSRDLFRKRSIRKSKRRACSPLNGACLTGGTNPNTPLGPINNVNSDVSTPPGSAQSSPRKYRGSRTSTSLKVKGLLGRVWARDSKSKSCENLHVL
ncbi:uncharacterized protein Rgk1 isoform X2 [Eurosta solidaginis]|uniref:uncharacterized protein Rgk1 isoform X2 n=1 Tax=Eurosta solidaginis TaxID=178769 RepID=UPI0035308457